MITAVVGGLSFLFLQQANEELESMYQDKLLPVKWLNDSRAHTRANETFVYQLIFADLDQAKREAVIEEISSSEPGSS